MGEKFEIKFYDTLNYHSVPLQTKKGEDKRIFEVFYYYNEVELYYGYFYS